jgi:hypothetical protein
MKALSLESGTKQAYLWQGYKSPTWWVKKRDNQSFSEEFPSAAGGCSSALKIPTAYIYQPIFSSTHALPSD